MTTDIRISVTGGELLKTAQENQAANRSDQLQKEADSDFLKAVRRAEETLLLAEQAAQRFSEGGVLEYGFREETSAQRKVFGIGGWLDVNTVYRGIGPADAGTGFWVTDDAIQINVGSGNGKKWATATLYGEFDQKGYDGTDAGTSFTEYSGFLTFVNSGQRLQFVRELPPGATETIYDPAEYAVDTGSTSAEVMQLYFPQNRQIKIGNVGILASAENRRYASYLTFPVSDNVAIVVVPIFMAWRRSDIKRAGAEPPGELFQQIPDGPSRPGVRYITWFRLPYSETGGENRWIPVYGWYELYENNVIISSIDDFGIPQTGPFHIHQEKREDVAFVVSGNKVRQIAVPTALSQLLAVRFPAWEFSNGFYVTPASFPSAYYQPSGYEQWSQIPASASMGAEASRIQLSDSLNGKGPFYGAGGFGIDWKPPSYLFGSPGIYDYVDNNLNDYTLVDWWSESSGQVVSSSYAPERGVPLFAPDHTVQDSGFAFLADYNQDEGEALLWSFLLPAARINAQPNYPTAPPNDPFSSGNPEWLIDYPEPNPSFYFSYLLDTADGVKFNLNKQYAWVSANPDDVEANGYMKNEFTNGKAWQTARVPIALSGARQLPPSLYLNEPNRQVHPYIDLTVNGKHLSMICWTGWGQNWRAKLLELGFSTADLRP